MRTTRSIALVLLSALSCAVLTSSQGLVTMTPTALTVTSKPSTAPAIPVCSSLQYYGKGTPLAGKAANFGYGFTTEECCYRCPFSKTDIVSCGDKYKYKTRCCEDMPVGGVYTNCVWQSYIGEVAIPNGKAKVCGATVPATPTFTSTCSGIPTATKTVAPVLQAEYIGPAKQVLQPIPPPGVKPGSKFQVMCLPQNVMVGEKFHTTVRWCLQRPRKHHITFDLLNMGTKDYYGGAGFTPVDANGNDTVAQCGEHTFKYEMPDIKESGGLNLMWKFFISPIWGDDEREIFDPFPNMLAETGIATQPGYNSTVGDCVEQPDRLWDMMPTWKQDAIDFITLPTCIPLGQPWSIDINHHLESRTIADFRVNLQIGTGGDEYLGEADIFVGESVIYGVTANTPDQYWTVSSIPFDPANFFAPIGINDRVYIAAFFVPAGQMFGDVPEGWTILDREFYLHVDVCGTNNTRNNDDENGINTRYMV